MIKRIVSLILSLSVITGAVLMCPASAAAEEYLYGYITGIDLSYDEYDNDVLMVRVLDGDTNQKAYIIDNSAIVNGKNFKDIVWFEDVNPERTYARFKINSSNKITELDYDAAELKSYREVEYDTIKKKFNENGIDGNLPVYYRIDNHFVPLYLDENHVYDIDTYKYAVVVTKMSAKDGLDTITELYIERRTEADFKKQICISGFMSYDGEAVLCAEIYDSNKKIASGSSYISYEDGGNCFLGGLPNTDAVYTIKLWLERDDERVSPICVKEVQMTQTPVLYGEIIKSEISEDTFSENQSLALQIQDNSGNKISYFCSDIMCFNGKRYRRLEDLENDIPLNSFAKYTLNEDGEIDVMEIIDNWNVRAVLSESSISSGEARAVINLRRVDNDCQAIMAVYDKNHILSAVSTWNITPDMLNTSVDISCPISKDISADDVYVKIYFWENSVKMKPAGAALNF